MTWDHSRGFDPMLATSAAYGEAHPGVTITWEKRSLQAFADRPIGEMADAYDLMVIDHPHVGEVAGSGLLLPLDGLGRDDALATLAAQSVGVSHRSYEFGGRQWALAIDAATPVAAFRPDRIDAAPRRWADVLDLARTGDVGFALIPINALMCYLGLANNKGFAVAKGDRLMSPEHSAETLETLREIVALVDPRCLTLDPIGISGLFAVRLWLHQLQPRRLLPLSAGVRRCAGVWRQRSARHGDRRHRHRGFGALGAP
jgi:multiple sugar transport system substrate-binding protein